MDNWSEYRKQQRTRLIAQREAIAKQTHHRWSTAITTLLKQGFPLLKQMSIGIYWPFRGEYDPRPVANYFRQQGATPALPEIINKNEPLSFREWWQEAPMIKGAYGIPIPDDTKPITIDTAIIPMVGFDQQGYRLGYGSGYFDRTLAAQNPRPMTIGVAFKMQQLHSIHPQPYDIAMQFIVTESQIYQTINNALSPISVETCAENTMHLEKPTNY